MSEKYQKAFEKYQDIAAKAKSGDRVAMADKARAMAECRAMEREANREGRPVNPVVRNGKLTVDTSSAPSRRSLQEEYTRQFNDKEPVRLERKGADPYVGTLRDFHADRLLGKK